LSRISQEKNWGQIFIIDFWRLWSLLSQGR
jgi:hypothetical protein